MSYTVTGVVMDVSEVTLADMAGWWPTTHVLWDMLIELGWRPLAARRCFINTTVAPYRLEYLLDGRLWIAPPETLDVDDPFADVESFQQQLFFPVATPSRTTITFSQAMAFAPGEWVRVNDDLISAEALRRAINALPALAQLGFRVTAVDHERNTITIEAVPRHPSRQMTIVMPESDEDRFFQFAPATPGQRKRRAKRELQAARPAKRLDGRRRR